jgi:hypothetical protein
MDKFITNLSENPVQGVSQIIEGLQYPQIAPVSTVIIYIVGLAFIGNYCD